MGITQLCIECSNKCVQPILTEIEICFPALTKLLALVTETAPSSRRKLSCNFCRFCVLFFLLYVGFVPASDYLGFFGFNWQCKFLLQFLFVTEKNLISVEKIL